LINLKRKTSFPALSILSRVFKFECTTPNDKKTTPADYAVVVRNWSTALQVQLAVASDEHLLSKTLKTLKLFNDLLTKSQ